MKVLRFFTATVMAVSWPAAAAAQPMHKTQLATAAAAQSPQSQTRPQSQEQQRSQERQDQQGQRDQQGRQDQRSDSALRDRLAAREPAADRRGSRPVQMVLVTSAARITSSPTQFYGVPVSVHAQVGEYANTRAFTLDAADWWNWWGDLTVIVPNPASQAVRLGEDDWVTVVGTVRQYVRAELERDYDWFDDLPDLQIELEGKPVLVADLARRSDGATLTASSDQVSRVFVAQPGDIADVPGRFYGRTVSVYGEVEDVKSARAITLDEEEWFAGPDVLVINPSPAAGVSGDLAGEQVTVIGTVRPFISAEFEQDYDWFNLDDYRDAGLDQWERRPVIVASSIRAADAEHVQLLPVLVIDTAEARLAGRAAEWPRMQAERRTARRDQPQREQSGTAGTAGRESSRQPSAVGTSGQQPDGPITSLSAFASAASDRLIGRDVRLDRVPVLRAIDDRTYLVGASDQQAVVVRMPQAAALTAGRHVRVEGRVQRAPSDAAFGNRPHYIDATSVSPVE